MIIYLVQKYLINSAVFFVALVILPLTFSDNTDYVIARGFIFGGIFGGAYTLYDFNQRKIWPLYDNLRHSKYVILFFCYIGFQSLYFLIKPFI